MKVDAGISQAYTGYGQKASSVGRNEAATFSNALAVAASQTKEDTAQVKKADLTNMTPMDMRDWLNDQIRTGKMTLDESSPFMGMTIGAEVDNRPMNFIQKIKGGIEAAIWRNEPENKARFEMALSIAERYQYQSIGINTFA